MSAESPTAPDIFLEGFAYADGIYILLAQAAIPITDRGYRRSDATYDIVGVLDDAFSRLDDYIARFCRSMNQLRLRPAETDEQIEEILSRCVRRSGLWDAYVAMDCLRGKPKLGLPRHPANCRNYLAAFAIPWVRVMSEEMQTRGAHLIIAKVQRVPAASLDPTVNNFHWADLTRGSFESADRGADSCIPLDAGGFVTEGPGFDVFVIIDGGVVTPERGTLEGMTWQSVIGLCDELGFRCSMRLISAAELQAADYIFLATTAGRIMPASRIDERMMSDDKRGPISTCLREQFWNEPCLSGQHPHALHLGRDSPFEGFPHQKFSGCGC